LSAKVLCGSRGLRDVIVVEEKRSFIEDQLVKILYNLDAGERPLVVGKRDEAGAPLLPSEVNSPLWPSRVRSFLG
jgi:TPP-dependent indolepyruvate ferredoxin oxidoreductase alpha subunit